MMMQPTAPYRMSFTVGGLFQTESLTAAELYRQNPDWDRVRQAIFRNNLFQARTQPSLQRICREVLPRLQQLSAPQLAILQNGAGSEQPQILWIAVCKRYAFIRDFAVEVIREKLLLADHELKSEDYTAFFNAKAEWHPELDRLKHSTRQKIRQVLFRMLREAEMLSPDNLILPALPTPRVADAVFSDPSGIHMALPMADTFVKEWIK